MWPFTLLNFRKPWQKRGSDNHRRTAGRSRRTSLPLALEALEDRLLMSAEPVFLTAPTTGATNPDVALYAGTSSGSTASTLLKDFGANVTVSNQLTLAGSQVFFVLQVPIAGGGYHNQLWGSDGTAVGTQELENLDTSTTTNPYGNLTAVGNQLYFTLSTTTSTGPDNQLWVSNGTKAGTQEVYDAAASTLGNLTESGSQLYFTVQSSTPGSPDTQLFVSNGSMAGTTFLTDLHGASYLPLQTAGNEFYFTVSTTDSSGNMDLQLWGSNGTASGTAELADLASSDSAMPTVSSSGTLGSQLYLIVYTVDSVGNYDYQLWVSNGTPSGTVSLADTGLGQYAEMYPAATPQDSANNQLAFVLSTGSTGDTQLWATNGTKAGTNSVFNAGNNDIDGPTLVGSNIYFDEQVRDSNSIGGYDNNLYGSSLTTGVTTELEPTQNSSYYGIFTAGNQVYAEMEIYTSSSSSTTQLYALTPSAATSLASNVLYQETTVGNQLYFFQPDASGKGTEWWVTNGTQSTTIPLFDIGMGDVDIGEFPSAGSNAYSFIFSGSVGSYDYNVYVSDGTAGDTAPLVDLGPNEPYGVTSVGSQLYFDTAASKSSNGSDGVIDDLRLYTSNGTPAGTTYTDLGMNAPGPLVVINSTTTPTLSTPTASPSFVAPGATLTASVNVASGSTPVNEGTVTFTLTNSSNTVVATDPNVINVSNGAASDTNWSLPATLATGTYNLVATYSDNGGTFAGTSNTASNAVNVSSTTSTKPTLSTPTTTTSSVAVGATLKVSVGVTSGSTPVNEGSITFALTNSSNTVVATDPNTIKVSNGTAAEGDWVLPSTLAAGTYNLVATYSDNGGSFAGASNTASNAVTIGSGSGPGGSVTVGAEYPGSGVWLYNPSQQNPWQNLTPSDAHSVANGAAGLVGAFDGSVWLWTSQSSWQMLTNSNASQVAINDSNEVAAIFPGAGLWLYTPAGSSSPGGPGGSTGASGPGSSSGTWTQLTTSTPTSVTIDDKGTVTAAFAGAGLWSYSAASGWTQITTSTPNLISSGSGYVVGQFNGAGVWLYNNSSGKWQQLTNADASCVAVDASGDVLAAFGGAGVWSYRSGQWTQINSSPAAQCGLDSSGDIFADFSGGLQEYLNGTWKTLTSSEPGQFSV